MTKDEKLFVRMDSDTKRQLSSLAERQLMSMSSFVRNLVSDEIRANRRLRERQGDNGVKRFYCGELGFTNEEAIKLLRAKTYYEQEYNEPFSVRDAIYQILIEWLGTHEFTVEKGEQNGNGS